MAKCKFKLNDGFFVYGEIVKDNEKTVIVKLKDGTLITRHKIKDDVKIIGES